MSTDTTEKRRHARMEESIAKDAAVRAKLDEAAAKGHDVCMVHCVVCGDPFVGMREHRDTLSRDDPDRWRCEDCISAGRHLRWPLTGVNSSAFAAMPNVQRLHEMAVAHLDSARVLCEALGGSTNISWPRASVVLSMSSYAVELFLKACILTASPIDKLNHNNHDLVRRFEELFPALDPPDPVWDPKMGDVPTDQLFRYGANKSGASLKEGHLIVFSPPVWIKWIDETDLLFRQVWSAITPASST